MSAAAPASLRERYAAWSLDAVAVGGLATLLTWTRLVDGWQASTLATTQLLATVRTQLFDVLATGVAPAAASTALLRDPTVVAAATALQSALGSMLLPWLLVYAVLAALWHIGGERSRWQGSPGCCCCSWRCCPSPTGCMPGWRNRCSTSCPPAGS
jgi:hypothetical protein